MADVNLNLPVPKWVKPALRRIAKARSKASGSATTMAPVAREFILEGIAKESKEKASA